jgi:hypothetical protein
VRVHTIVKEGDKERVRSSRYRDCPARQPDQ